MEERKTVNAEEYLNQIMHDSYFILDTTEFPDPKAPIHGTGDVTFTKYCYNTHRYNKLRPGSLFLYRQPTKTSKAGEFYFFGGGYIKEIRRVAPDGSVEAIIERAFLFDNPIFQSNPKLDKIVWTSKNKKPGTWEHFWNQYGMNQITRDEYMGIVSGERIILI